MKKAIFILMVLALVFSLTACDFWDYLPGRTSQGQNTQQATTPQNHTTVAPTVPEVTEPSFADVFASYQKVLTDTQAEFSAVSNVCGYLLYDMEQDGTPEMIVKVGSSDSLFQYRFYSLRDSNAKLLKAINSSHSGICGYSSGKGVIIYQVGQSVENVTIVTLSGDTLAEETILNRTVSITHPFVTLSFCQLNDPAGLEWTGNPADSSDVLVAQIRQEEQQFQANLVNTFTTEQMREINVFLSNFSEQRFQAYPVDIYDLLNFVYKHCEINRARLIRYSAGYAYIDLEDVNNILWEYFGRSVTPDGNYVCYNSTDGDDIVYKDGFMRYTAASVDSYGYVTIVTEMTENSDGTYNVLFNIYSVNATSLEKYYKLRAEDVAQYSEMKLVATGSALVKTYQRTQSALAYQLVKYYEN